MKKFLILFMAPTHVIDNWKATPEETRKPAEEKMRADWGRWMGEHGKSVTDTAGAGKTKRVTGAGTADVRNDVMLYSMVEAQSHADAARMFESHPHLTIPEASIEVMEVNQMGMG